MTVRPQHHRRPLPRPWRHWRRLLYNLPHLISLLSLLFRPRFRPRHHKTNGSNYPFGSNVGGRRQSVQLSQRQ